MTSVILTAKQVSWDLRCLSLVAGFLILKWTFSQYWFFLLLFSDSNSSSIHHLKRIQNYVLFLETSLYPIDVVDPYNISFCVQLRLIWWSLLLPLWDKLLCQRRNARLLLSCNRHLYDELFALLFSVPAWPNERAQRKIMWRSLSLCRSVKSALVFEEG